MLEQCFFYCVVRVAVAIVKKLICRKSANASVLSLVRVAEHSFQAPVPNSTLFSTMLGRPFFARVKVNHRRVYSRILAKVYAVAITKGLVKSEA